MRYFSIAVRACARAPRFAYAIAGIILLFLNSAGQAQEISSITDDDPKTKAVEDFKSLPLHFEANLGQTAPQVRFATRGEGYALFLTADEAVLSLKNKRGIADVLRMQLLDASSNPLIEGRDELPGKVNYFIGNDPSRWLTNLPTYARVFYDDIYPGIDLVYYGTSQRQLEYDFVLSPGTDLKDIRMCFHGADGVAIDEDGNLRMQMDGGEVVQYAPVAYQDIGGRRVEIDSRYNLDASGTVTFEVDDYDPARALVIDPVIEYSTYLGGVYEDEARGITVDVHGYAFVTGQTLSNNYPLLNPVMGTYQTSGDAYITKINKTGTNLVFSSYIGGSKEDAGNAIAINDNGDVFITGSTTGNGAFPVLNEVQTNVAGGYDVFVTKLKADGSALLWSTLLGGTSKDEALGITVDDTGDVYITGYTKSANNGAVGFPCFGACYDNTLSGLSDAFVTKLDDNNTTFSIAYSTYFGGSQSERAYAIAVDSAYQVYVTGKTRSNDYPTVNAVDPLFNGDTDAFVTKFDDTAGSLLLSTFIGGGGYDVGMGIDVDVDDNIYITGYSDSDELNYPGNSYPVTANAFQPLYAGGVFDAVVTKFNSDGTINYSSFLGSDEEDRGMAIAVDIWHYAHVTGFTLDDNTGTLFPTVIPEQDINEGGEDAFVTIVNASGSGLNFSTFLGGTLNDRAFSIAIDGNQDTYVAGVTSSLDFPTLTFRYGDPFQDIYGGGDTDAFVTKYSASADLALTKTVNFVNPLVGQRIEYTLTVTNNGPDTIMRFLVQDMLPPGVVLLSSNYCTGNISTSEQVTCDISTKLAVGMSFSFSYVVQVRASTVLKNCASVINITNDPNGNNNNDCVTIYPREQATFWMAANQDAGTVTALAHLTSVPQTGAATTINAGTVFAGTDGGGVYRSTDQAENWFPTDLIDRHVRAMDTNLLNPSRVHDVLWVGTYDDGAYRSTNLGQSYAKKYSGHILSLVLNNYHPKNNGDDGDVFIGTDSDGIKYSSNAGNSWSNITYNLASDADKIIRSIAIKYDGAPQAGRDRVFVGTHGHGVWYLDYTGGGSPTLNNYWVEANGDMFDAAPDNETLQRSVVHALAIDSHGNIYAGTNDGLYRSTDSGAHWRLVLDGIINTWDMPVIVRSLEVYECNNVEYIVAGTDGSYVWRAQTNASMSTPTVDWTQYTGLMPVNNTASGLQSKTVLDLLFTEIDSKLYAGTMDKGVHRSDDCGEIWEQKSNLNLQDGYRVIQSLVLNPNGNRLYGGTFGFGVIMSDDINSASPILYWTRTNNGILNPWIYAMALTSVGSTDYLFAGTWNGGVFRSTDDGETWQFSGLPNRIVYDIDVNSDGVIFAATDRGEVSRSIDNGLTWQEIGVANTAIWSLGIDPWDPDRIYAGTFGRGVFVSSDGGFTWTHSNLAHGHIFDFTFGIHPEYKTDPQYANTLFAATATGVLYTIDGGVTWYTFEGNHGLTVPDTRAIAFAGNTLLAGTWGGGVFLYDEKSDSWIRDGLPGGQITTFAVNPLTEEVFLINEGRGVYRKQYPVSASTVANEDPNGNEVPATFELEQNYPNPFNPSTQIEFSIPETGNVRIAVYDALGRRTRMLVDGILTAGSHSVTFEAGDLPSGVYFYRLETNHQSLTKSMILMK